MKYSLSRISYFIVKLLFKITNWTFYANHEVHGIENIPSNGQATIVCFNHGNSLCDPIALASVFPRSIRFCGKNTLWDDYFVRIAVVGFGVIPIFRKIEHAEKAQEFNRATFRCVYETLLEGDCVGFSPEGVSSFRSHATKFKSGIGYIALETVALAVARGNPDFSIKILPAVMAFTHREKFRKLFPLIVNFAYV